MDHSWPSKTFNEVIEAMRTTCGYWDYIVVAPTYGVRGYLSSVDVGFFCEEW
jgi:hypothetical protein